jgi:hypothetical protein
MIRRSVTFVATGFAFAYPPHSYGIGYTLLPLMESVMTSVTGFLAQFVCRRPNKLLYFQTPVALPSAF